MLKPICDMSPEEIANEIKTFECNKELNYVFISYSHMDSEKVYPIVLGMMRKGYNIYIDMDFENHGSDENWLAIMKDTIENTKCKLAICFRSENYLYSYAALIEVFTIRSSNTSRLRVEGPLPVQVIQIGEETKSSTIHFSSDKIEKAYALKFERMKRNSATFAENNPAELLLLEDGIRDWYDNLPENHGVEEVAIYPTADSLINMLKDNYLKTHPSNFYYSLASTMIMWFKTTNLQDHSFPYNDVKNTLFDEYKNRNINGDNDLDNRLDEEKIFCSLQRKSALIHFFENKSESEKDNDNAVKEEDKAEEYPEYEYVIKSTNSKKGGRGSKDLFEDNIWEMSTGNLYDIQLLKVDNFYTVKYADDINDPFNAGVIPSESVEYPYFFPITYRMGKRPIVNESTLFGGDKCCYIYGFVCDIEKNGFPVIALMEEKFVNAGVVPPDLRYLFKDFNAELDSECEINIETDKICVKNDYAEIQFMLNGIKLIILDEEYNFEKYTERNKKSIIELIHKHRKDWVSSEELETIVYDIWNGDRINISRPQLVDEKNECWKIEYIYDMELELTRFKAFINGHELGCRVRDIREFLKLIDTDYKECVEFRSEGDDFVLEENSDEFYLEDLYDDTEKTLEEEYSDDEDDDDLWGDIDFDITPTSPPVNSEEAVEEEPNNGEFYKYSEGNKVFYKLSIPSPVEENKIIGFYIQSDFNTWVSWYGDERKSTEEEISCGYDPIQIKENFINCDGRIEIPIEGVKKDGIKEVIFAVGPYDVLILEKYEESKGDIVGRKECHKAGLNDISDLIKQYKKKGGLS